MTAAPEHDEVSRGVVPPTDSSELLGAGSSLVARAERDGYLFFHDLIPADLIVSLRDLALAVAREFDWLAPDAPVAAALSRPDIRLGAYDDPRWVAFLQRVMPHPLVERLRNEPRILSVLGQIFGRPAVPHVGDILRVVSSDNPLHTTPPHQDRFYVQGAEQLWTVWMPLGECPLSLGPLAVLLRSHRDGLLPHVGDSVETRCVEVPAGTRWVATGLVPGDAYFFSGLTVHRALPNRAGRRLRLSIDFRYRPIDP